MRSTRETADSAGSGNQLLPNPGSIRALINMETGESGPLKAVKTFVLKNPYWVLVCMTHKVASGRKKPSSPITEGLLGPQGTWAGKHEPHQAQVCSQ